MLLGLSLLYVGAVLILNGLWLSGRIEDREIVVINLVVAGVSFLVAIHTAILAESVIDVRSAAMTLLFATTYLWVAYNRIQNCDGRGLGWFSLFVSVTVAPLAVLSLAQADSVISFWLGLSWAAWAVLWLLYFLLLSLQKPIQKLVANFTLFCGIFTAWLPGMLLLFEGAI